MCVLKSPTSYVISNTSKIEYFDHFLSCASDSFGTKTSGGGEAADPPALPLPYSALPYSYMNA